MTRHPRGSSAGDPPPGAVGVADERLARVIERPDGFHWIDETGHQEFGPFETLEETLADMDAPTTADEAALARQEAAEQGLDLGEARGHPDDEEFGDAGGE